MSHVIFYTFYYMYVRKSWYSKSKLPQKKQTKAKTKKSVIGRFNVCAPLFLKLNLPVNTLSLYTISAFVGKKYVKSNQ